MQQNKIKLVLGVMILLSLISTCLAKNRLPVGLMLNLNFQEVQDGLIPNNAVFPLHVPVDEKSIKESDARKVLAFEYEQGMGIPHSSLLDPDGDEWIITARVHALSDGIVLSQSNNKTGYVIYIKDGAAHAVIKTGPYAISLKENPATGIVHCLNNWVTIELRIKSDMVILKLNRKRAAYAPLDAPLDGDKLSIWLGHHKRVPAPLKNRPELAKIGFTGAIKSLKVHRQRQK